MNKKFHLIVTIVLLIMAVISCIIGDYLCALCNVLWAFVAFFVGKSADSDSDAIPKEESTDDSDSDVIPEDELTDDEKRVKRMAEEYDQLAGRYYRLCNFIESDKFKTLSEESQFLLTQQKDAMTDYVKILRQRIEMECENANLKTEYPLN